MQYAERFSGATADEQINAAIGALNGNGGIVDARVIAGTQMITRTIIIPTNTVVELSPSVVYTCTVSSGPCWKLTGQGSKLLGGALGIHIGHYSPSTQVGTILRMGPGITSTTDMIAINPDPPSSAGNGGYEIGNVTIDFADLSSKSGRYCIVGYAINHSYLHDIQCLNPGLNGLEFETTPGGWSYDNRLENILVQAAADTGFNWTTVHGGMGSDFDRWYCDRCKYAPGSVINGVVHRFGMNGFALNTGSGNGQMSIADFFFTNLWVGGTSNEGNAGFFINRAGTDALPYVENIFIHGEIEQLSKCHCSTAVKIHNEGPPRAIQLLTLYDINDNTGFWAEPNNLSPANILTYTWRNQMQMLSLGQLNQSATNNFAGTCEMSGRHTCDFRLNYSYSSPPICVAAVQSASPTTFQGSCAISGNTVTIRASTNNFNTWAAVLIGNPR
ncbi:MAG: hypothetical protein WB952_20575 [Terriglobales bacterium]